MTLCVMPDRVKYNLSSTAKIILHCTTQLAIKFRWRRSASYIRVCRRCARTHRYEILYPSSYQQHRYYIVLPTRRCQ